jgi:hypothetical protein
MINRRKTTFTLTVLLSALGVRGLHELQADPPSLLAMFKRKADATTSNYQLKAENGPWLILAKTISGDDAQQKAEALAKELRTTLKMNCYVLDKSFDHSKMLKTDHYTAQRLDGTVETRTVRLANDNKERVFAVLVGDFGSLEDPAIKDVLQTIRTAQPTSLSAAAPAKDPAKADSSNWMVDASRRMLWKRTDRESNQAKGPMGAAFITRNPLLPEDFFQAPKLDDFVVNLNKNLDHSLLKCPKRYTVRVATFNGKAATVDAKTDISDALDAAADQANRLTAALRAKGAEAYQFHDRYASYVTIGSFDDVEVALPNGERQLSPEVQAILNEYTGYTQVEAKYRKTRTATTVQSLKSLENIPFDYEGKVMSIPRQSTSKLYGGSLLGRKSVQQ